MPSPLANPFVGPRPFEAGETLYGREHEIAELGDRLISERIVLLHSPSGAGKSSLVRAGLLPELHRFFDVWGPTRINQEPTNGALNRTGTNRYVMSAVQGFEEEIPERGRRSADVLAGQTLAEYFTGRPRRRKAPANVLLIFDQFEEVLTVDALGVEAKEAFFDQLGEVLRMPRAFALFVLREDYLAPLDPYSRRVPTHLRNRFRIDLLGLDAAREAMVEPARTGGREFPAVDQLIHDLATRKVQRVDGSFEQQTGRHVEPVQLQVTCRRLWDAMPADDLSIDPEDLKRFGDVTEALGGYYADSVALVAGGAAATERAVREWFDQRLITAGGIRGQVLREAGESGGLANERIEALRAAHLIRAEERAGATWYELAHDRLVEPVQGNNKAWRDEHLSAVQQRATLWERQERPPGLLMKDEELAEGERWAADDEAGLTDVERRFLAVSRKEQDAVEKERRQARRIRVLAVVSLIAAVLAGWLGVWAYNAKKTAEEQKEIADHQSAYAELQRALAVNAEKGAITQARIATSGRLAATVAATADDFIVSSLLANESWNSADTFEAKRALLTTLRRAPRWRSTIHPSVDMTHSAFSPDGKTLAMAFEYTVRFWDVATGQRLGELTSETGPVKGVAFSPDGKILAWTSNSTVVHFWDVANRRHLDKPLVVYQTSAYGVGFSPDGKILASTNEDKTVRLWNFATGEPLNKLTGHEGSVYGVGFSPDGELLASASQDKTVRLWDVATGDLLYKLLTGHENTDVSFSPDGKLLASASQDKTVWLWDVATGNLLDKLLTGHQDSVHSVGFSPDGKTLASSGNRTVRLWDVATGESLDKPLTHKRRVFSIGFSLDGKILASASADERVRLWDVATGDLLYKPLTGHWGDMYGATLSPDGKLLASTSSKRGKRLRLWDVSTGNLLVDPLTGHKNLVSDVAFSPDGKLLASASDDHTVRLWDVATGDLLVDPLIGHTLAVQGVAFSPDGETLASASDDHTVRLWDVSTGNLLVDPLTGHTRVVQGVAFSPDGEILASASRDQTVRLWDVATGAPLGELTIDLERYISRDVMIDVGFSPDGKTLVSIWQSTVQLWDVETRQPLGEPLTGHKIPVFGFAFSPDGKTLAVASAETVRLWDVDPGSWLARSCARAGRNFSLAEWQRYVGRDVPYRRTCPDLPPGEGVEDPSAGEPQ